MKKSLQGLLNHQAVWPVLALMLGVGTLLAVEAGGMPWLGNPDTGTESIIALELAGDAQKAHEVISHWEQRQLKTIAISAVQWDYAFLFVYSTVLALGCLLAGKVYDPRWPRLAAAGIWLALAQWVAALLDGIENFALLRMLRNDVTDLWARVALVFALSKFALISLALVYILSALIVWAVHRLLVEARRHENI